MNNVLFNRSLNFKKSEMQMHLNVNHTFLKIACTKEIQSFQIFMC
jgi:hypothetical protein